MVSTSCADIPAQRVIARAAGSRWARLAPAVLVAALGCNDRGIASLPEPEAGAPSDATTPPPEGGLPEAGFPDAAIDAPVEASADSEAGASTKVTPAPEGDPWRTLEEWHLFRDARTQAPADRVVPYDVNAPLFADYAAKHRFIYVPEGRRIGYRAKDKWRFPVGTILIKTFSYLSDARDPDSDERLLETRLLIREAEDWATHTYVWNEAQTEAVRKVAGSILDVEFIDPSGDDVENRYLVPNENECRTCHGKAGDTNTLGGRTRQLDRDFDYGSGPENQIDHLAALGFLDTDPEPEADRQRLQDPFGDAPVFERVRAYFDGNCAHCHLPGDSEGSLSGLWLDYASTAPSEPKANWGLCKQPQSAGGATCGRRVDVVPGQPDRSVLICRMESTEPDVRMAPLGRTLAHAEGVALMREWISGLEGECGSRGADASPADAAARESGPPDAGGAPSDAPSGDANLDASLPTD